MLEGICFQALLLTLGRHGCVGRSLQGEETARALTKDPGRKPGVCAKTSVQMKLKGGLRELTVELPLLGW